MITHPCARAAFVAVAAVLAVAGCAEKASEGGASEGCDPPCGAGQTCTSGTCTTSSRAGAAGTAGGIAATTGGTGGTTAGVPGGGTGGSGPTTGGADAVSGSGAVTGGTGATTGGTGATTGGTGSATSGAGGTSPVGACQRTQGSCSSPEVSVTEIDVGVPITPYGTEQDDQPLPMAIAAMPSGGSRVAWRGTDGNVYVAELDCNDQMVGSPISFPAHDVQDIYADDAGGVLLLTRRATGSGADNCGPGMLCGGTSVPCYDMDLVRFSADGTEEWVTPVTNLSSSLEGYDNGARFIWERYQHHGRIAFDGSNYAAYFCIGITVDNNVCVDIHEGDRMQVVSGTGEPLDHPNEFEVGCSHSWTTRMVWDPRNGEFVTVCATDRPRDGAPCRIARSPSDQTIAPAECDGRFWGGDLVLDNGTGYWTAYTQAGSINLVHFTDGGPDQTIDNAGSADHAKLVTYGGHMLLAWASGSSMAAKVLDSDTGATVGSELTIDVSDHNYHAFKAYPDGSVAYPAAGSSDTSMQIARVMPCQ